MQTFQLFENSKKISITNSTTPKIRKGKRKNSALPVSVLGMKITNMMFQVQ
jgi:hypothetical protein